MMTWPLWIVVGVNVLNLILQPYNIGKPREPRTATEGIISSMISALMIVLVLVGA